MGTVTVLTAERMLEIEAEAVVNGEIEVGEDDTRNLVLLKKDGTRLNLGNVGGISGPGTGGPGPGQTNVYTAVYEGNY
jgi:hypothetical protein